MRYRLFFVLIGILALLIFPVQAQDVDIDEIIFAWDVTIGGVLPIQEDTVFPETITELYVIIEGDGLDNGDEIEIIWLYEGDEVDSLEYEQSLDDDFRIWSNWISEDGMEEGEWSVEVYHDGDRVGEAEFEITDDEYIYPIRFAEDCGRSSGILVGEGTEFEDLTFIYVKIEWVNFNDETVELLWEIEGEIFDLDLELEIDDEGWECAHLTNGDDLLPSGEYRLYVVDEDGDEYRESDEIDIND